MSDREQFRCDRMCGANRHGVCGTNGVPAFLMTLPGLGIRKKRVRPLSTITPAVSARADAPWSPVCLPSGRSHTTRLLDSVGVTTAMPKGLPSAVLAILFSGEQIEDYPEDAPYSERPFPGTYREQTFSCGGGIRRIELTGSYHHSL